MLRMFLIVYPICELVWKIVHSRFRQNYLLNMVSLVTLVAIRIFMKDGGLLQNGRECSALQTFVIVRMWNEVLFELCHNCGINQCPSLSLFIDTTN